MDRRRRPAARYRCIASCSPRTGTNVRDGHGGGESGRAASGRASASPSKIAGGSSNLRFDFIPTRVAERRSSCAPSAGRHSRPAATCLCARDDVVAPSTSTSAVLVYRLDGAGTAGGRADASGAATRRPSSCGSGGGAPDGSGGAPDGSGGAPDGSGIAGLLRSSAMPAMRAKPRADRRIFGYQEIVRG